MYAGDNPSIFFDPDGLIYGSGRPYGSIAPGPSRSTGLPPGQRKRTGAPFPYGVTVGIGASVHMWVVGISVYEYGYVDPNGRVCAYTLLCIRVGPGFFVGGGVSAGPNAGNPPLEGLSYGGGFDIGTGQSVGGSVSYSGSSVSASTGVADWGGGAGISVGADFCIATNLVCNDGCNE